MRSLLGAGVSLAEVARRTGVPYNVVRRYRDQPGDDGSLSSEVGTDDPGVRSQRRNTTTRDEIRRLISARCSRADVARRLDISRSTVSYHDSG
jgi:transposase-like protein